MSVLIVTSVGDIEVDLHTNQCPLTAKNFLKLCKVKYYNGCLFHNVQKGFVAQTGDPTGTGTGGDSVYKFLYGDQARFFDDEIRPELRHSKTGTVAMAGAGKNRNASQFYITLRDDVEYLDGEHTVFGMVADGFDTLTKISEAYVDSDGRPFQDIRIKHTYVLDDPFDDPPKLAELIPGNYPIGKPRDEVADERLGDSYVPSDEAVAPAQLEEMIRVREAHTNTVILEGLGNIPDADIMPPENVLFVRQLNSVTRDEDLYTIFSRVGTVTSAETIRDYRTGDSLCYAFIEFETKEACARAYENMNDCLIDDRRIKVDFSQSASKEWAQFRLSKKEHETGYKNKIQRVDYGRSEGKRKNSRERHDGCDYTKRQNRSKNADGYENYGRREQNRRDAVSHRKRNPESRHRREDGGYRDRNQYSDDMSVPQGKKA